MENYQTITCLLLATLTACKSSDAGKASTPCESGAPALAKQLEAANGIGVDRTDAKVQKDIESAKAAVVGKRFSFVGCRFVSQGGDEVSFAAAAESNDSIDCVMAGGEDATKTFRRAAAKLDMSKLRLDVSGVAQLHGEEPFRRVKLTDCKITPHE
jgi:hypothetical protein